MKERQSKRVKAIVLESTDQATTARVIIENVARGSTIHTDEAAMYQIVRHQMFHVKHSVPLLLANAEPGENSPQKIFRGHFSRDLPERIH